MQHETHHKFEADVLEIYDDKGKKVTFDADVKEDKPLVETEKKNPEKRKAKKSAFTY